MVINCIQHLICKFSFCVPSCTFYFIQTSNFISVQLWPLVQDILDQLQILMSSRFLWTLSKQQSCAFSILVLCLWSSRWFVLPHTSTFLKLKTSLILLCWQEDFHIYDRNCIPLSQCMANQMMHCAFSCMIAIILTAAVAVLITAESSPRMCMKYVQKCVCVCACTHF